MTPLWIIFVSFIAGAFVGALAVILYAVISAGGKYE